MVNCQYRCEVPAVPVGVDMPRPLNQSTLLCPNRDTKYIAAAYLYLKSGFPICEFMRLWFLDSGDCGAYALLIQWWGSLLELRCVVKLWLINWYFRERIRSLWYERLGIQLVQSAFIGTKEISLPWVIVCLVRLGSIFMTHSLDSQGLLELHSHYPANYLALQKNWLNP